MLISIDAIGANGKASSVVSAWNQRRFICVSWNVTNLDTVPVAMMHSTSCPYHAYNANTGTSKWFVCLGVVVVTFYQPV